MDTKSIFKSLTVWGGAAALIAGIASIFGYTVSEADVATTRQLIEGIVTSIGGLLAIIGRIRATKAITL